MPLPDRNTTLPHPEADTSKNARIEAPDNNLARTHTKSSFLHRRHHSQETSKGSITIDQTRDFAVGRHENDHHADGSKEKKGTGKADEAQKSEDIVAKRSEYRT